MDAPLPVELPSFIPFDAHAGSGGGQDPQPFNPPQDLGEQNAPSPRHLGQLEHDVADQARTILAPISTSF